MKRVQFIVQGDVQGVYYRSFVKDRAGELGLNGFTRNLPNKTVEVLVEGHEAKIQKLLELCKQGPRNSHIENITTKVLPFTGEFKMFRIKY